MMRRPSFGYGPSWARWRSSSTKAEAGQLEAVCGASCSATGTSTGRVMRPQLDHARNLSLFLMVHDVTPTLEKDAARLGLTIGAADGAYIPVSGTLFPTWIVMLNALAEEEGEPLIGELGSRTVAEEDRASLRWLAHFYMANEDQARKLEDFEELKARFMKSPSFLEMTRAALRRRRTGRKSCRSASDSAEHTAFGEVPDADRGARSSRR